MYQLLLVTETCAVSPLWILVCTFRLHVQRMVAMSPAPNQSPINPPYKTACELKKGSHVSQPGTIAIMNSDPTPGDDKEL